MANKREGIKTYLKEYCEYSSIPGVRYLAEDRPILEKIVWISGLLLSLVTCIYLIAESWELRKSKPVILAKEKHQYPVWDIPFPAVTICPIQKISDTTKNRDEVKCAYDMVCDRDIQCDVTETIEFFEKHSLDLEDIVFEETVYVGRRFQKMKPVLTNEGLCFSMNMMPGPLLYAEDSFHYNKSYLNFKKLFEWDEEGGYSSDDFEYVYPTRALPGIDSGLLTILKVNKSVEKDDLSVTKPCQHLRGFLIKVHSPTDAPSGDMGSYVTAPSNARITVQPRQLTSEDLRSYTPAQRQCYYPNERQLEFFKVYSQNNCEQECLSKMALECCGCVSFYMPRNLNTTVCDSSFQANCIYSAKENVLLKGSNLQFQDRCNTSEVSCNCLPSCSSLAYESSTSLSTLHMDRLRYVLATYNRTINETLYDYTVLQMYYTEAHFIPYRRMEMYGSVEFISNIGGLLGLFLGFCAMSLVEFVYWLVMRPLLCLRPMHLTEITTEELEMQLITPPGLVRSVQDTHHHFTDPKG